MLNQVFDHFKSRATWNVPVRSINPSQLLSKYNPQFLKKGEIIFLPEETSSHLYYIVEGKVKLSFYHHSGRSITKSILGKGDIFGEYAIFGTNEHKYFAGVWKDATICSIPIGDLIKMTKEHHDLTLFLMNKIGTNLFNKEKQIEALVFKNSRTRIIEFLLNLAKTKGQRVGYEQLVNHMMTHQEIADLTATSRQTVTTTIGELKSKNILTINRKRMLVRNMENLAAAI